MIFGLEAQQNAAGPRSSRRRTPPGLLRKQMGARGIVTSGNMTWIAKPDVFMAELPVRGGTDVLARLVGQGLSERLRQSFVIDNRPGANTNIAIETVAKATPDGYMLGILGTGAAISAALYEHLDASATGAYDKVYRKTCSQSAPGC